MDSVTFRIQTGIAWLSGTMFLSNPLDITYFKSWINWGTIFVLMINVIQFSLHAYDYFYLNLTIQLQRQQFESAVSTGLAIVGLCSVIFIRLYFMYKARRIATFFTKISSYIRGYTSERLTPDPGTQLTGFAHFLLWFGLLVRIVSGITFTFASIDDPGQCDDDDLECGDSVSLPLSFVFFLFSTLPYELTAYVAFVHVLYSTKFILNVFNLFCNQLETGIRNKPQKPWNKGSFVIKSEIGLMSTIRVKHFLIKRFKEMYEIFNLFDEINGPILIAIFPAMGITLVQLMDRLLVHQLPTLIATHEIMSLLFCIIQMYLLQMGYKIHQQIVSRKDRLAELLHRSPKTLLREDVSKVRDILEMWKWQLSASGFFVVDRTLMSGIISLILAYTVVLFQLQEN